MPALEDVARRARLVLPTFQSLDRGPLHGLEDPRVDVGLQLADQPDQVGAAADPTDAPAGHVECLRQRVELESDLLRAWDLEQAQRPVAVERDLRVRRVVAEHDSETPAESDRALERLAVGHGSPRIVPASEPQ